MTAIERVRKTCLALPEAHEQEAWGEPTFRVGGKMFAMFSNNHHNDGRIALLCHAPPGAQAILVASSPETFYVPPYVGPRGWVGIILDLVDDAELEELVMDGYCMVAPKRLQTAVSDGGKGKAR